MAQVMIVDDVASVRLLLKEILVRQGHVIVGEAENGVVAVDKYRVLQPDLVTMDVKMPIKDGIQALKEIIHFNYKAKIIVLSAVDRDSIVREVMEAGAKDLIEKPFLVDQVINSINRALETHE